MAYIDLSSFISLLAFLIELIQLFSYFQRTVLMKLLYYDDVTVGLYLSRFL